MRSFLSRSVRGYWVHQRALLRACFHAHGGAIHSDRYLRSYGTRLRPFSLEADSSSEFLRFDRCFHLSAPATTYQGFCPLRDLTTARPLVRGFPSPRFGPSSGVLSLSTVCSALSLVSLFHPTATLRARPVQGFCRSAQPPSLIERSCPRAVEARFAHRRVGCHDPRSSTSRLFSVQSRDSQTRRLDLARDRSPLRFRCSSRSLPDRSPRFPRSTRS